MSRERQGWGTGRTALGLAGAFAAGCLPSGRLVTRLVSGASLDELGDGKPGSANVGRSVGWGPAAVVLAMDAGKAFAPAAIARRAGAGDGAVVAMGIAATLGHITVVKGRGAACALGAFTAMDAPVMGVALVPLLGGVALHRHPQAVAVTGLALPAITLAMRRRPAPALRAALFIALLFGARLKGSPGAGVPGSWAIARNRLWLDRDEAGG